MRRAIQWEGKFDAVFENKKARLFFQILQENKTFKRFCAISIMTKNSAFSQKKKSATDMLYIKVESQTLCYYMPNPVDSNSDRRKVQAEKLIF